MNLVLRTEDNLIGEIRMLTREDADSLEHQAVTGQVRDSKQPRVRHHRIAQLVALGRKGVEIAEILDIHPNTITLLMASPAFQGLVKTYQKEVFDRDFVLFEKMTDVAEQGLMALQQEIVLGQLTGDDLRKATMDLFDRTGRGPTKKVENTTKVSLSVEDLREIKDAEFRRG